MRIPTDRDERLPAYRQAGEFANNEYLVIWSVSHISNSDLEICQENDGLMCGRLHEFGAVNFLAVGYFHMI